MHCLFGELLPGAFNPSTSLAWSDIAVDIQVNPSMVHIHLKKSKCDQFGAGVGIILGHSGKDLCPVSALLSFISARGSTPGPFFLDSGRKPIIKPWFVEKIRECLNRAGLPQHQYAGHSFRIGAATTAAIHHSNTRPLAQRCILTVRTSICPESASPH